MKTIALQAIPKQSFPVTLNGTPYTIELRETNGCMSMSVMRGTEVVVLNQRCVAGQLVLPYLTLEDGQGNFLFLTQNDALPSYEQFGLTQTLLFASEAELNAVRATPRVPYVNQPAAGHAAGAAIVAGVGRLGP